MRAPLLFLLLFLTTALFGLPLLLFVLVKALIPVPPWRTGCTRLLRRLGEGWIFATNRILRLTRTDWDIEVPSLPERDSWYLVLSNHQSWVDIPVFLKVFGERLPFPVFFTKKELLWLPLIGQAIWGLDFPLVERYPREKIERYPELRGRDLKTAREACQRARRLPTTLVIFPEGTRRTAEKHRLQGSHFRHLLRPRPGGVATVLGTLGERLGGVYDLTVVYTGGTPSFFGFLAGRVTRVVVRVRKLEPPAGLQGENYTNNLQIRRRFQRWLEEVWREKDDAIETIRQSAPGQPRIPS